MYIAVIKPAIQYAVTRGTLMENFNTFYLLRQTRLSGTTAGELRFHCTYHVLRRLK